MDNTMLIEVKNPKAVQLMYELEELLLIKVLDHSFKPSKMKLSEKYRGILSKEEGQDLNEHINQIRGEWNNI